MTPPDHHADELWPLLKAGLSPALGTPTVQNRLKSALARMPILSGGGFECRLAPGPGAPLDLALRTTQTAGGMARLASSAFLEQAEPASVAEAAWQRLQHFAAAHQAKSSALGRAVPESWLEFDLEKSGTLPAPSFFMRLDDHYGCPPLLGPTAHSRQQVSLELLSHGLSLLGVKAGEGALASLLKCLRHRPASASLKFLGVMLAREQPGFRVTVGNVPLTELTAYLRDIGWTPDHRPLVALIYFMERHVRAVSLQLEITAGGVSPGIGMELGFPKDDDRALRWRDLLAGLVRLALSSPEKAAAVQEWPALLRRVETPKWPKGFTAKQSWLTRSINHVKLSYHPEPDMPFEPGEMEAALALQIARSVTTAKAYLAFNHPEP